MHKHLTTALLAGLAFGTTALAGDNDKKIIAPLTPLDDAWRFSLSMPGWIPWLQGDSGVHGITTHIDLGPDDIVPRIDMVADVRMEARKGRFSIMGEFLYMSLSDGIGTNTVVQKLDVQVDQTMGDLGVAWRIIGSPRGYLDVTAGVRYMNYYQKLALQPNDERIEEVVDSLAAVAGNRLRSRVAEVLAALAGKDPTLPIAPLDGDQAARLAATIGKIKGTVAERKAKIKQRLHDALDRTVSRTDDWWDPYIGLRGRYNLNDKFYLTGKGDIGGFGVGSDLTWTAEAALGCQLSSRIFTEVGYRALGVDLEKDGLTMDTVTHGAQVTLGITF